MAALTMAFTTSHAPQLGTAPENWDARAAADKRNERLAFRGETHTYAQVEELRGAAFAGELGVDVYREKYARCRSAIDRLEDFVRASGVDVLVIVSSDHKETFNDEQLAPFVIYWGDTVQHEPLTQADLDAMAPGLAEAEAKNVPSVSTTRQCDSALALHLIESVQNQGFDVAASQQLPAGKFDDHGIPHGWGFVMQQVLKGDVPVPIVPVFVNTFWHPNPPSASRSYDFGLALAQAIKGYPADVKVGIVGSGGLSHFVVDEELDRTVLDAFVAGEAEPLRGLTADVLVSGSSEIRNWIVAGAAANSAGLQAELVDYVPAYRTEAGTGCGMGFMTWKATQS
jgi:3-O-methylgallate 3,4-dioxygenase